MPGPQLAINLTRVTGIRLTIGLTVTRWQVKALDPSDVRIQALLGHQRSLHMRAETFRFMLKHIKSFASIALIPRYKLQDALILERFGFERQICGRIPRIPYRPALPL